MERGTTGTAPLSSAFGAEPYRRTHQMSFMATLLLYISDLLMDALAVIHLPLLLDLAGKGGQTTNICCYGTPIQKCASELSICSAAFR